MIIKGYLFFLFFLFGLRVCLSHINIIIGSLQEALICHLKNKTKQKTMYSLSHFGRKGMSAFFFSKKREEE
jgi:hypothetical protein